MTLSMVNTQMTYMDWIYDYLQQENMKLQIQVQDFTREIWSMVLTRIPQHGF